MMSDPTLLQAFPFYRSVADPDRAALAAAAEHASLAPGQVFYREGETCGRVGLVRRGDLRVFRSMGTGREMTLYHVRDGELCLVNMLSAFLGDPARASAIAEEPTDAILLPAVVFRKLLTHDENLLAYVFTSMATRFVDVVTLVEEISVRRMDARLAALLLRRSLAHSSQGVIRATHDELASELGTAREVVTRLLNELERGGGVRLGRGRITLVDLRALQVVAEAARLPGQGPVRQPFGRITSCRP